MTQSAFHVTPMGNLPRIQQEGLLPQLGPRSVDCGEAQAAVFLFPNLEACETALGSWLGECFDDEEPLVILEVLIPPGVALSSNACYEVAALSRIPPECIRRVWEDTADGFAELPFVAK